MQILGRDLKGLDHPGGKFAPRLHLFQIGEARHALAAAPAPARLAVATASWMARLMPTPPMGDMACAASPMQTRPGRAQFLSRSTVTVRSLTWSKSVIGVVHPAGGEARDCFQPVAEFGKPVRLDGVKAALGNQIGALPVIGAIDHHEELAALDLADQIDRIARQDRQAQPQHVEGRAQILDLQARTCRARWNGVRPRPR